MDNLSKQIEAIVREVVQRLQPETPKSRVDEVNFVSDRVVTLAQVEQRINGIDEIFVRSDAVVTPAVNDLLKEKSVRLVRRSPNQSTNQPLLVGIHDCDLESIRVTRELAGVDIQADVFVETVESRLMAKIVEAANETSNSVVITSRPYRFGCHANRDNLRAIVAHDETSAARGKTEASANLLVLDATTFRPSIVRSFCNAT